MCCLNLASSFGLTTQAARQLFPTFDGHETERRPLRLKPALTYFFPAPDGAPRPRRFASKKIRARRSSATLWPQKEKEGFRRPAAPFEPFRVRPGNDSPAEHKGDQKMAQSLGTVTKREDGGYEGTLAMMTLNTKITIVPNEACPAPSLCTKICYSFRHRRAHAEGLMQADVIVLPEPFSDDGFCLID